MRPVAVTTALVGASFILATLTSSWSPTAAVLFAAAQSDDNGGDYPDDSPFNFVNVVDESDVTQEAPFTRLTILRNEGQDNALATAILSKSIDMDQTPIPEWPSVEITTTLYTRSQAFQDQSNQTSPVLAERFAVGYAEGYATYRHMYYIFQCHVYPLIMSPWQRQWVTDHLNYLESLAVAGYPGQIKPTTGGCNWQVSPYCQGFNASNIAATELGAFKQLMQFYGLVRGYNAALVDSKMTYLKLSHFQLFWMAFKSDVDPILLQLNKPVVPPPKYAYMLDIPKTRIGAYNLIALTPNDVLVGHNTIDGYTRGVRYVKTYRYYEATISMTATAGYWGSGDDMIVTSNGLVITSTPLQYPPGSDNRTAILPQGILMSQMRVMIGAETATSGAAFAAQMAVYPSGAHLCQYVILDRKQLGALFPGQADATPLTEPQLWTSPDVLLSGFFTLVEEGPAPGPTGAAVLVVSSDQTRMLASNSWFASHGIPFHSVIASAMNVTAAAEDCRYGRYFHRFLSPLHLMTQDALLGPGYAMLDVASVESILRRNAHGTDDNAVSPTCSEYKGPYPACVRVNCSLGDFTEGGSSALIAIAPRGDLVNASDSFGVLNSLLGQRNQGAIDGKVLSLASLLALNQAPPTPAGNGSTNSTSTAPFGTVNVDFNVIWGPASAGVDLPPFDWYQAPGQFRRLIRWGQPVIFDHNWKTVYSRSTPRLDVFAINAARRRRVAILLGVLVGASVVVIVLAVTFEVVKRRHKSEEEALHVGAGNSAAAVFGRVGADASEKATLLPTAR